MTKGISQRYTGPDFLKFVCAFLAVGIHTCSILGASKAGYMLFLPITRVAVLQNEPLFEKKWLRSVAALGRKTSTAVFIMHPMVIFVLSDILPALSSVGGLVTVPLVFILCVGIALLIEKINQTRRLK